MMNYAKFSTAEGNLLMRLLIAFVISFIFTKSKSSNRNNDFNLVKQCLAYLVASILLTLEVLASLIMPFVFFGLSFLLSKLIVSDKRKDIKWPIIDILLQVVLIGLLWLLEIRGFTKILPMLNGLVLDFKIVLIVLSYLLVMQPIGAFVALGLKSIKKVEDKPNDSSAENDAENENGGKLIGIYERIIILTFVLLNQYEAIGFLITGKSIIRFSTNSEHLRSEYVLVGTMMSYALSILLGILVNWLLMFA